MTRSDASRGPVPSCALTMLTACGLAVAAGPFAMPALAQGPLSEPFQPTYETFSIRAPIGFSLRGEERRDWAGRSVSSAGDVNGDGVDDLVIGAQGNRSEEETGDAYVVFGRAGGGFPSAFELASLDGTTGFKLRGFRAEGQTGYAVSRAGDVNNDGIDDVIIGVPTASNSGGYSVGECYVVYGRDAASGGTFPAQIELSDLNGSDGFRIEGYQGVTGVGASLAAAGDANGDGIDDVIIGGARVDGSGSSGSAAFVVFGRGSSSGSAFPAVLGLSSLDGANGFRMPEVERFEECGTSVAGLGDVNGDGLDDIVVGAPKALGGSGRAYVVFGRDTVAGPAFPAAVSLADLDGGDGFRLLGSSLERAGTAVASAGDINADGTPDIAIGAPTNFGNGSSYVVFGRPGGGFDADVELGLITGDTGFHLTIFDDGDEAQSGAALAPAGDINGDGFDDLAVGAPGWGYWSTGYQTYSHYGAAFVVFGRDTDAGDPFTHNIVLSDLDGEDGFGVYGSEVESWTGISVAAAGDLNGDGQSDLAIGARGLDRLAGGAFIVYGRDLFPCEADLDGDGELTIFDFLTFGNLFDLMDPAADFDGDGDFTIFDFLAFQNAFDAGCQ